MSRQRPRADDDSVAAAQTQLRTSLASVLASAGVSADIDFVSADLDRRLARRLRRRARRCRRHLGKDTHAFVQITPRLGRATCICEQGTTSGSVTSTASAASLQLCGLETLFRNMTASLASPAACSRATTGIATRSSSNAQMSLGDGDAAHGLADVSAGLCGFFGTGDDGNTPIWGSSLHEPDARPLRPVGAAPVCPVSFTLAEPRGDVMPVGSGMAVTKEDGAGSSWATWCRSRSSATARAQRTKRIDSADPGGPVRPRAGLRSGRRLGPGLRKVSQRDADGMLADHRLLQAPSGRDPSARLSLWTPDGFQNGPASIRWSARRAAPTTPGSACRKAMPATP